MALTQFNAFEPKLAGLEGNMQAEPRVFAHDVVSIVIGAINNSDSNHGLDMTSGGSGYSIDDGIVVTTPGGVGAVVGNRAKVWVNATDSIDVNLATSINKSLLGGTTTALSGATNTSYPLLEPGVTADVSTSGAGTGLILTLTVSGGIATVLTVLAAGTGYVDGDTITFATGTFGPGPSMVVTIGKGAITDYEVNQVGILSPVENSLYLIKDTADQVTTGGVGIGFSSSVTNIDIPNTQKRGCCIYVGDVTAGGTLTVTMESGNEATFNGIAAGSFLPILVKRVEVGTVGPPITTTTAASLLALY
jgi:hypothetical protein